MSKKTIAIIGATGRIGSTLSKNLAKSNYRLLLFDHNAKGLNSLARQINQSQPHADVEYMSCASDASWEADIIIPDVPTAAEQELVEKIKPFTNRKVVVILSEANETNGLEKQLAGARVVRVLNADNLGNDLSREVLLDGNDAEAVETAKEIFLAGGFLPIQLQHNNNNTKHSKLNSMETTKWSLDPTHSEIHFKIRHLMVSWVTGNFKNFDASVETEGDDISTAKVRFSADINSISTNNEQRDAHLRTGDFFDAQTYPKLSFESDRLEKIDEDNFKLHGTLTMRGKSKKVALNVEFGGITQDPWGNTRTGFSLTGKINRKDFGVSFSMVSETGGVLLGEDVNISANVEFVKQVALQTKAA